MIQKARRKVEVSAGMLMHDPEVTVRSKDNLETWESFRNDVWVGYSGAFNKPDAVAQILDEAAKLIEEICRPVLDRQFGRKKRKGLGVILDWLGL